MMQEQNELFYNSTTYCAKVALEILYNKKS